MLWLACLPPCLAIVYLLWQWRNYRDWQRVKSHHPPAGQKIAMSVVVPFRNEAGHLDNLLAGLTRQSYPPADYELLLVDDHSTDEGVAIVKSFGADAGAISGRNAPTPTIQLLHLADLDLPPETVAYKKAALTYAIAQSKAAAIVTTDADCSWPDDGLALLAKHFSAGADVVLGPVFIDPASNLCEGFQALDLAGYQLFTAACVARGRPALANGAHFAFRRSAFSEIGGYTGVDHLASGDDVLLLHKLAATGKYRVTYNAHPDAAVSTRPVSGWRALWRQRLRWAGKAGAYQSAELKVAQALAFLTSLGIVTGLLLGVFSWLFAVGALLAWGLKAVIDRLLLADVCHHYGRKDHMRWYWATQFLYPFYLVAIGTAALLGIKVGWKGRGGVLF